MVYMTLIGTLIIINGAAKDHSHMCNSNLRDIHNAIENADSNDKDRLIAEQRNQERWTSQGLIHKALAPPPERSLAHSKTKPKAK